MGEPECKRLSIEQYAAGELSGDAARAVETHLNSCAECSARYAQIERDRSEFLHAHPFEDLQAVGAVGKAGELWYERIMHLFGVPVLRPVLIPVCIALLVTIMIIPFTGKEGLIDTSGYSDLRYKGSAKPLSYIYKRNGIVYESAPGDVFIAGDKIQLFYDSRIEQYLSLFSVSAKGEVSFYHPDEQSRSCSIRTGVGTRLAYPVSIELDSSAGNELVVALFSKEQFDTAQVKVLVAKAVQSNTIKDHAGLEQAIEGRLPRETCSVATLSLTRR
jgi:hypothetical protein